MKKPTKNRQPKPLQKVFQNELLCGYAQSTVKLGRGNKNVLSQMQ